MIHFSWDDSHEWKPSTCMDPLNTVYLVFCPQVHYKWVFQGSGSLLVWSRNLFFFFLCALRFLVYSIWFGCFVSKHFDLHIWFDLLACFSISKGILNSGFLARFQYYSVLKIWKHFGLCVVLVFLTFERFWFLISYHLSFVSWHSLNAQFCRFLRLLPWLCQAFNLGILWGPDDKESRLKAWQGHKKKQESSL